MANPITPKTFDDWATDPNGPVALYLNQKLVSVEGEDGIIFPPTYADIGYNIDKLSDGTLVVTIDSVGSQANRLEPLFKSTSANPEDWLVPQIHVELPSKDCGDCDECKKKSPSDKKSKNSCQSPRVESVPLLDLAHRAADAVVRASSLSKHVQNAFKALQQDGDAGPLCGLAPTSLLFGVWDSRGSGEKRPRLVRSVIRAWNVELFHSAAQFNSIWKRLPESTKEKLESEANPQKTLSEKGFKDAPAIFRKFSKDSPVPKYRDGAPNPEARILGGVHVLGKIERRTTINLVALRGLRGKDDKETTAIRKYLLGLALYAATTDLELFLREGCLLHRPGEESWEEVPRRGTPTPVDLAKAKGAIGEYAHQGAAHFRGRWPQERIYKFEFNLAKEILKKKSDDSDENG